MNIRFLSLADQEVDDAVAWYNELAEGLGRDFLDELDRVIRLIRTYPLLAKQIEPEIGRFLFPAPEVLVMPLPVKLHDVIEAMDAAGEEHSQYLDKRTGEIFMVTNEEMEAADEEMEAEEDEPLSEYPDWQRETILKAREILKSDDFVELPTQFDIDEYKIMEEFCLAFDDRQVGEQLLRQIKGSGAFRRFRNAIYSMGVEKAWYEFRRTEIEKLAIEWLEEKGIGYTREDEDDQPFNYR